MNPPLLPIPEDVPYPFVGDGGPDGLNITSKVIRGAGDKLTDSGYLSAIGMIGLGTNNQSAFERIQNDLLQAGLNGVLTIISSFNLGPQSGWIDGIACTSVAHAPGKYSSKEEAVKEISRAYKKIHYDRVCTYHLKAWRERQPFQNPILTIQDCSADGNPLGPWIL